MDAIGVFVSLLVLINKEYLFRMTGNAKQNQKFTIESSGPAASSEPASGVSSEPPLEPPLVVPSEPPSEVPSEPPSGEPSRPKVDESSVMVSGMVPMFIEYEGKPIWISKDLNSKRAFRPERIAFEVSV